MSDSLQKIDAPRVQWLLLTKRDHATIRQKCYRLLRQICAFGVRFRALAYNPVADVDSPKTPHRERHVWTRDQARAFLAVAAQDTLFGPCWQLLVETGLRRGEALGLRWSDVNSDAGTMRMQQTVTVVDGTKTVIGGTRTPRSRLTVPISATLRDALRTWKDTIAFKHRKADKVWQEHGLVFPTAVGTPHSPRNVGRTYDDLVKLTGVPRIRIHDIRHTSATLAMESGAPLLAVSKRLGHARPSTTSDMYGHVTEGMEDAAAIAIAEALYG